MGSGNEYDKPCHREEKLIKNAADDFIQAVLSKTIIEADKEGEK